MRKKLTSMGRALGVLAGVGFLAIADTGYAQILHANGPLPSFEVATVRPWQLPPAPLAPDGSAILPKVKFSPGGGAPALTDRVHFIGQAQLLIAAAYNIPFGREQQRPNAGRAVLRTVLDASRFLRGIQWRRRLRA
jgi:hypothetical protein